MKTTHTRTDRTRTDALIESWAGRDCGRPQIAERSVWREPEETVDRHQVESELTLLGIAAMVDPPRPEVADAVARCHSAGIRLIVMTGDHGLTARIAKNIGIGRDGLRVITGTELDAMPESG